MTVLDEVRALIERLAPNPVCYDCVADRRGPSVHQHANHKTRKREARWVWATKGHLLALSRREGGRQTEQV